VHALAATALPALPSPLAAAAPTQGASGAPLFPDVIGELLPQEEPSGSTVSPGAVSSKSDPVQPTLREGNQARRPRARRPEPMTNAGDVQPAQTTPLMKERPQAALAILGYNVQSSPVAAEASIEAALPAEPVAAGAQPATLAFVRPEATASAGPASAVTPAPMADNASPADGAKIDAVSGFASHPADRFAMDIGSPQASESTATTLAPSTSSAGTGDPAVMPSVAPARQIAQGTPAEGSDQAAAATSFPAVPEGTAAAGTELPPELSARIAALAPVEWLSRSSAGSSGPPAAGPTSAPRPVQASGSARTASSRSVDCRPEEKAPAAVSPAPVAAPAEQETMANSGSEDDGNAEGDAPGNTGQDAPAVSLSRPAQLAFAARLVPLSDAPAAQAGKPAAAGPLAAQPPDSSAPAKATPPHSPERGRRSGVPAADTPSETVQSSTESAARPPAAVSEVSVDAERREAGSSAEGASEAVPSPPQAAAAEPATAPRSPAREIRLELAGTERRVEVRLAERAGEVRVAVRTPDGNLAEALRDHLPALSARLEQSGFHADQWRAGEAQTGQRTIELERSGGAAHEGREQPDGQRQSQQNREQPDLSGTAREAGIETRKERISRGLSHPSRRPPLTHRRSCGPNSGDVMTPSVASSAVAATGTTASTTSASTSAASADQNMFLQLLVTQLKNQNPLNPTDGTQFVTELAQFQQLDTSLTMGQDLSAIRQDLDKLVASYGSTSSSS
jgi:hypothetical protein